MEKLSTFKLTQCTTSGSYSRYDIMLAGFISLLHLLAAIIYIKLFGISIRVAAPWGTWEWFWQTLPLDNLRTDLWHSIWFLHAQPPIFNLLGGILAKLFYPYHLEALHVTNILLGGLLSGLIYLLATHFTSRRYIAIFWALIISLNSTLFLYEAYILYSLLTAFLIVLNLSCVLWHQRTKSAEALYCFIGTLNLLILARSAYHIVLIPAALVFVWLISEKNLRTRTVLICMVICLTSVSWYAKNYALFGFFGASSWSGQSLWRIASFYYSEKELQELSEAGIIDRIVAERQAFQLPSAYEPFGFQKHSRIAVLSNDDYNNINIPDVSAIYGKNAVRLIMYRPWIYTQAVLLAFVAYCLPSSQHVFLALNFNKIFYHDERLYIYLQQLKTVAQMVLLPITLTFYFVQVFKHYVQRRWDFSEIIRNDSTLFWCFFMISYSILVTCMVEIGENNRFKFELEQLIWLFIPIILSRIMQLSASSRSKNRA